MKKTLLFILLPLFTLTSCEDWFDITPKSELKADDFFETEQGMRDAHIGIYATMADEKLYGGLMTMTYMDVLGQYYSSIGNTLHSFYYAYNYDTPTVQKKRVRTDSGKHSTMVSPMPTACWKKWKPTAPHCPKENMN